MRLPRRTVALAAVLLLAATPAIALTTYTEGTADNPFRIADDGGAVIEDVSGDERITLERDVVFQYAGETLDPRSIQGLPNGNIVFASRDRGIVYEITASGAIVWTYTFDDFLRFDPTAERFQPFCAHRFTASDGSQHTLITLRKGLPVIEVDEHKNVIWQYGTGVPGYEDGQLYDAFSATRLPNDNRLIVDNQGGRVIEVDTAGDIVWQYGIAGEYASEHAYAPGYLDWPRTAYRFKAADGSSRTLIVDQVGQRALIVKDGDYDPTAPALGYTSSSVVWEYGERGVAGLEPGRLLEPSAGIVMADGTILIAHGKFDGTVDRIDTDGTFIEHFVPEALSEPRSIAFSASGSLLIADQGNQRLVGIAPGASVKVTSQPIDCGLAGVMKRFTTISWTGDTPEGTSASLYYSIDGAAWTSTGGARQSSLPASAKGTFIRYRLVLGCEEGLAAPVIDSITITADTVTEEPAGEDDGSGTDTSDATAGTTKQSTTGTGGDDRSAAKPSAGTVVSATDVEEITLSAAETRGIYEGFALQAVAGLGPSATNAAMQTRMGGLGLLGVLYLGGLAAEPTRRVITALFSAND